MAFRDVLTDLPNLRAFEDEPMAFMSVPEAHGSVLMMDVDSFKSINDQHGHSAGDEALRAVAQAITRCIRDVDVAARLGGDEFAAILPRAATATATAIGERIRAGVAGIVHPDVSIGVAELSGDSRQAMLGADTALYAAKSSGRDRVVS